MIRAWAGPALLFLCALTITAAAVAIAPCAVIVPVPGCPGHSRLPPGVVEEGACIIFNLIARGE